MNIAEWLRGLGLGQYEDNFRDNRIEADILPHLTADDLKDMGVNAVGDRRRLLAAIDALVRTAPFAAPPSQSPEAAPASAERRPITVMFCDLVGSTSIAAQLDAEDWRNLVNSYLDDASKAVSAFGGHVLKKLGDGLMALFGYPHAQENDAERAVHAALAIQLAIADINARNVLLGAPELVARIGLENGPVVVDSAGEVFGEAPNVAARVQAAAEPGTVVATSTVQRQIAGLFIVEEKGVHELKGIRDPMRLYRILRVSGGRRRKGARSLTPLIGREEDLSALVRRWEHARAGEGQFVLITGDPGIGKSRLVEELRPKLAEIPHSWIEWSASQLLQNTPLHPITQWGRARFGGPEIEPERRLAELESVLSHIKLDPAEYAPLLAPLIDIPIPPERVPDLSPDEMHRKQLRAMADWAIAGARVQPIVLVFEDLQWFDPSSIELAHAISDRGSEAPLLVLATARPEFRPPWTFRSHHSFISLAPLDTAQVKRMVTEIAPRESLSATVVQRLSDRAGGVPLFVEELMRLVLERGENAGEQAIPPTLLQLLAARLDRLGAAREVAQIGAVLGRTFSYTLLRAVATQPAPEDERPSFISERAFRGLDEISLQSGLERLLDADFLFIEGAPPQATYRFKHALIQDAAYNTLLKSRRQALHQRTAEALIEVSGEPEAVAHHFTAAGLNDAAMEWWGKSGDEALRRAAFQEAIAHLGKAIAIADKKNPGGSQRDAGGVSSDRLLKLQTAYGQAVMWSKGFAADEAGVAFARVGELAARTGDSSERNVVYYAEWIRAFIRGDISLARSRVELLLREAEASGRATDAIVAYRTLGLTNLFQGELPAARRYLERALDGYAPERDVEARRLFGTDPGITAKTFLALLMWLIGEVDLGRRLIAEANAAGDETGHIGMICTNRLFLTRFELNRGDPTATLRSAEALLIFARAHDISLYATYGEIFANWARGRLFDPEAGTSRLRQLVTDYFALSNKNSAPLFYGLIADLETATGRIDDALTSLELALALAEETGERWWDSVLLRRKGEILLKRDPQNSRPVEEAFRSAIGLAKKQGARSYELIASLALAKRYQSTDRPFEAHAVLAPALVGFSPSTELPEIAEAQALLERLRHGDGAILSKGHKG